MAVPRQRKRGRGNDVDEGEGTTASWRRRFPHHASPLQRRTTPQLAKSSYTTGDPPPRRTHV